MTFSEEVQELTAYQNIDADEALEISKLLQQEIMKNLQQLSLESLKAITEFSAYLVDKEQREATQDIEDISDIEQKLQEAEAEAEVREGKLISWTELQNDL